MYVEAVPSTQDVGVNDAAVRQSRSFFSRRKKRNGELTISRSIKILVSQTIDRVDGATPPVPVAVRVKHRAVCGPGAGLEQVHVVPRGADELRGLLARAHEVRAEGGLHPGRRPAPRAGRELRHVPRGSPERPALRGGGRLLFDPSRAVARVLEVELPREPLLSLRRHGPPRVRRRQGVRQLAAGRPHQPPQGKDRRPRALPRRQPDLLRRGREPRRRGEQPGSSPDGAGDAGRHLEGGHLLDAPLRGPRPRLRHAGPGRRPRPGVLLLHRRRRLRHLRPRDGLRALLPPADAALLRPRVFEVAQGHLQGLLQGLPLRLLLGGPRRRPLEKGRPRSRPRQDRLRIRLPSQQHLLPPHPHLHGLLRRPRQPNPPPRRRRLRLRRRQQRRLLPGDPPTTVLPLPKGRTHPPRRRPTPGGRRRKTPRRPAPQPALLLVEKPPQRRRPRPSSARRPPLGARRASERER
mmetsp:Transcript_1386/g.4736  ORF Transcript_1386/g.4736 Transcript_1386/m.4736 type:complete len:464 (+) Transcript_1386:105-1496(+)